MPEKAAECSTGGGGGVGESRAATHVVYAVHESQLAQRVDAGLIEQAAIETDYPRHREDSRP
jgi:hypothetical protein